jgi:hypothetical protein
MLSKIVNKTRVFVKLATISAYSLSYKHQFNPISHKQVNFFSNSDKPSDEKLE